MEFLTNLWSFVLVLGVIIFCHEFGHFITAKAFGMRVFIFSFGFGRRLLGFKWGDTDCRLSLIPLGGYVKLEGEPEDHIGEDTSTLGDGRDFTSRPRWQRFLVYVAGPVMNVVLTLAAFTLLYRIGWGVDATLYDRPVIGGVETGSPAAQAGLVPGDEILAIDGKPQKTWEDTFVAILLRPGATLQLHVRSGTEEKDLPVTSRATKNKVGEIGVWPLVRVGVVTPGLPASEAGLQTDDGILRVGDKALKDFAEIPAILAAAGSNPVLLQIFREGVISEIKVTPRNGRIGIGNKSIFRKLDWSGAVVEAGSETWRRTKQTVDLLRMLLTAQASAKAALSGPVGIAQASGDAARSSSPARFLLYLVGLLSLSVGILNLFPLAPLDGGHLAILLGEGLLRRDFSITLKTWIMNAGAMVIFLLVGLILYSDLTKTSWLGKYLP